MTIIDGKKIAQDLKDRIKSEISELENKPVLAVIQIGDNPSSTKYVKNKERVSEFCGIKTQTIKFEKGCSESHLINVISTLNKDSNVNGILVQLPLPDNIDEIKILNSIDPLKDVDGFHPVNVAKLWLDDNDAIVPCTPKGIIKLIKSTEMPIKGRKAVVIGRSNIVGKPIAKLLLNEGATVTICHSKTPNYILKKELGSADIIVVAIGKPKWFGLDKLDWYNGPLIKSNAIVIDVGINVNENNKIVGDVNFEEISQEVDFITPVPGGVGPMTVACLMENTLECYKKQNNIR